jgi:hypothetical protein
MSLLPVLLELKAMRPGWVVEVGELIGVFVNGGDDVLVGAEAIAGV